MRKLMHTLSVMNDLTKWVLLLLPLFFMNSKPEPQQGWQTLFNGKNLSGWDTYIGPLVNPANQKFEGEPIGLNKDPNHVFSVVNEKDGAAIRISGENFGGISTQQEFENYHLQLKFKWGELAWAPKKGKKKDSGVLYHCAGPHGADYGFWMRSQEFQVQEGDCGDYWGVAGGVADIPANKKSDSEYIYASSGQLYHFAAGSKTGRHCIKNPDAENPTGQWNQIDIYCHGDTSVHVVNGKLVMVLYHNAQSDQGIEKPLTRGKLQIQSEGAEVFYKDIRIQPISIIPPLVLKGLAAIQ